MIQTAQNLADRNVIARALGVSFLVQTLLCMPLWTMQSRSFIAVPVLPIEQEWVRLLSPLCYILLLSALVLHVLKPQQALARNFLIVCLLLHISLDVHRLQVWVWFYLLWIVCFIQQGQFGVRLLCASMYAWAALNKINIYFFEDLMPEWQKSLHLPGAHTAWILGALAIFSELSLSVMVLWFPKKAITPILAVAVHAVILVALFSQGAWNTVVWPWNVTLPLILCYIWRYGAETQTRQLLLQIPKKRFGIGFVLAAVMPIFYSLGIWPYTLSWMLYSNMQPELTLAAKYNFGHLCTEKAAKRVFKMEDESFLVLDDWTFAEANVPPFQHPWVFAQHRQDWCNNTIITKKLTYEFTTNRFTKANESLIKTPCDDAENPNDKIGAYLK